MQRDAIIKYMTVMQMRLNPSGTELLISILEGRQIGELNAGQQRQVQDLAAYLRWRYVKLWGPLDVEHGNDTAPPAGTGQQRAPQRRDRDGAR